MYWTDLQQTFRIGTHMGGHDHFDFLRDGSRDVAIVTDFDAERRKWAYPTFILSFHSAVA